jgi:chromosome segregation ATPase
MESKINATLQTWAHVAAHLGCNSGTITDAGFRLGETPTTDELRKFLSSRSRQFGRWDAKKAEAAKRLLDTLDQPGENLASVQTPAPELESRLKESLTELQTAQTKLRDFEHLLESALAKKQSAEARLESVQTELIQVQEILNTCLSRFRPKNSLPSRGSNRFKPN